VQQGEIETVGSARVQKVNVRLISATNKNLIEEVKEGRFREDLYYRLNVFPITIPALRRRKEDIPHLARVFAERFSAEQKLPNPVGLDASALALLTAYDWPGNIRQLENAVFRAVVLSQGGELSDADFPQIALQLPEFSTGDDAEDVIRSPSGSSLKLAAYSPPAPAVENHVVTDEPADVSTTIYRGGSLISSTDETGNIRKLAEIEEELIRFALRFYRGQMSQVARKLGIGRSTLYRKLKDYGIDPDDPLRDVA
ncbi:sigma-54-dependent Fis family transcriptional regulator, partial [Agrobacterium sp. S2]|nr:sigma-54-dependent Fis family transcriptional regulator [Agrobacterium sp. S2]